MLLHNLLFILRFNGPVNNFSVNMGQSNHFLGINQYSRELMCLAQNISSAFSRVKLFFCLVMFNPKHGKCFMTNVNQLFLVSDLFSRFSQV